MTLVDSVFPVVGVVLSNALYFAPLPAVISAARSGVLGPSSALPQAVMVISTTAWVFYALSVPNFYITAANVPGVISSVYAISITLPLIPRDRLREREQVQAVLVGGAAIDLFLWVFLIASEARRAPLRGPRPVRLTDLHCALRVAARDRARRNRNAQLRLDLRTAHVRAGHQLRHVDRIRPCRRRHMGVGAQRGGLRARAGAAVAQAHIPRARRQ